MKKEHASFLVGGIFFGFVVGFSVAYTLYKQNPNGGPPESSMQAPTNPSDPRGMAAGQGETAPPRGTGGGAGPEQMMQQVQREMAALRKLLETNPKDARALGRMGDLYYDAGMFEQARDFYTRSLESDPKNPNINTDLGICYQRLGHPEEAIQHFRQSLAMDPKHWQSWLNIGIVSLFDKKDIPAAEEAFAKVKELNPSFEGMPQLQQALEQAKSGKI